jgi:hypothetical protein
MTAPDDRFRSRKFRLAVGILLIATFALVWGLTLCDEAKDVAIVMGPFCTMATLVLGVYNHYNVKANGG